MDLTEIRLAIDQVNDTILRAFIERMKLSEAVATEKKKAGLPILNKAREREIIAKVLADSGTFAPYAHRLFTVLFELSRAYQAALAAPDSPFKAEIEAHMMPSDALLPDAGQIACQGVEGAYSQMAADKLFPRGSLNFFKSFDAVFDAVESGLCRYGVLPIENSSNGSVRQVYTLLKERNVSIIRSYRLCVSHALLVKPGVKLQDVHTVISHEQALGQCSAFLKSLKGVTLRPVANTAMAAQEVASSADPGIACVSSASCAELYGLEALDVRLQNSDNNYTRFVVISKTPEIYPGANRISLIVSLPHRPGSLYEVIAKFAAAEINIVKLESYPMVGHDFEFLFLFEIEASVKDDRVTGILADLKASCPSFAFLGNYVEG
ncbi:MAG TPA: bifunctional chorismate mutase/prephenate dehydratase [Sutterella sp.]|nr:bifunctional chorismate mutase/prephenate dehydratase [Sutterella sp.]